MIETFTLLPGVELQYCRDARFKQGCLSIQMLRRMDAGEAAMNALIPAVLLRGTRAHPDLRRITMALDDLYGASVGPLVRRVGDCQTTGLICGFMDQRFALPGDRVLEPMVEFFRELLLDSLTEDGGFLPEIVESEKKNLIASIEAERNDKQTYAMARLLRLMCREDSFGLPRLGEPEQVAAIDPKALYRHYRRVLEESPIRLFYVGSADSGLLIPLLQELFQGIRRAPGQPVTQTAFCPGAGVHEEETMDVVQGKLCLGFTTPITNRSEGFAAMQMLNAVFGGGMTSKLFMNVREKQSLCYSIGSGYYSTKGILTVFAGIDARNLDITRQEILHQLELCRAGEITDEELTAARESILSGLRAIHDTPGGIESYYSTAALSGLTLTPGEYMAAVQAVERQQIADAAQTVELNSSFFLNPANAE